MNISSTHEHSLITWTTMCKKYLQSSDIVCRIRERTWGSASAYIQRLPQEVSGHQTVRKPRLRRCFGLHRSKVSALDGLNNAGIQQVEPHQQSCRHQKIKEIDFASARQSQGFVIGASDFL